jgi:hypothetical protein
LHPSEAGEGVMIFRVGTHWRMRFDHVSILAASVPSLESPPTPNAEVCQVLRTNDHRLHFVFTSRANRNPDYLSSSTSLRSSYPACHPSERTQPNTS